MKTKLFTGILKSGMVAGMLFNFSSLTAQIASWTYEPLQGAVATPTPNTGAGSSSIVVGATQTPGTATGMDPVTNAGCGPQNGINPNGAWQFNAFDPGAASETNGVQYGASTVGYGNITFSCDIRFSNTAPNTIRLKYTTDGVTWLDFAMTGANTSICAGSSLVSGLFKTNTGDEYRRITVNFSAIMAVNNNANFKVRILAAFDPAFGQFRQATTPTSVATNTGTWRFDNVIIGGTAGTGPTNTIFSPSGITAVCAGSATNLRFLVTGGTSPYTLVYHDSFLNANFTLNNYISATNVAVSPTANTVYSLVSIVSANGIPGVVSAASTRTVNINPLPTLPAPYILADISDCTASTPYPSTVGVANFPIAGTNQPSAGYTTTYSGIAFPYAGASTTFTVSIRNNTTLCTWTSPVYNFTRYVSPSIATPPSTTDRATCSGTAFSALTVAASGSGISYQWYSFDGTTTVNLNSASEIARGSQTASYTPQSSVLGTLRYYVRVSGYCSPAVNSGYSGYHTVNAAAIAGTVAGAQTICTGTQPADLVLSGQTGTVIKWQRANDVGFTMGVADIAIASNTLPGSAIGNLGQTTYFIAYVQNGTCTVTTIPVQVLIKSTTYKIVGGWNNGTPDSSTTAKFDDDFLSTGNINACSVSVISGNVVIDSGDSLIIQNNLDVLGGTLTFENNASLVQVNNSINSGNITYKRDSQPVRKFDYTYWSSPVDLQVLSNIFTPGQQPLSDKYFWFNTAPAPFYGWQNVAVPALTPMDIGKGYIIRAPQGFDPVATAVVHAAFTGVPNNGDYSVNIVKTGLNDLNCIGNPYPSALNARKFIEENTGAFGAVPGTTLYFWTHNTPITNNGYTFNDYAVYNLTGGTVTAMPAPGLNTAIPNGMIAAGQSFMVKGVLEGTQTATFKNDMREVANNDQFFRLNDEAQKSRLWLELKNNAGAYKQILVGYVENASDALDNGYDGAIIEAGNAVSFYSLLQGKKLAIQGKSIFFNNSDVIPLGFRADVASDFEIALSNFDGFFDNQDVFIEDRLLGIIHNLKDGSYVFATQIGTFDDRFQLRFNDSNLAVANQFLNGNQVVVYQNAEKLLTVNSGNIKMKKVEVFDSLGRTLDVATDINQNEVVLLSRNLNQVVLLKIQLITGQILTKKYAY